VDTSLPEKLPFVSRGGLKLDHALNEFGVNASGLRCADLGCSTGGFTDCLLQRGASRVHAVDTAYGEFAWKLRNDARVALHERSNAMHFAPPETVDLVVIDLGWTKQDKVIPVALKWLDPENPNARILTLIKPHYEAGERELGQGGLLDPAYAEQVANRVRDEVFPTLGVTLLGWTKSPVLGGAVAKKKKRKGAGNPEWLALLGRD
jgi:23S rRNA (cytidine1920-2'-O)/16S rRNA (cytidine1409-2'-O)-methyltransferase